MAVTNLTNLTSTQNTYELVIYANQVTNGILFNLFIIVIFIILILISMRRYEWDEAMTASAFVTFGFSIFFSAFKLLNFKFVIFFGVVAALGAFWLYISGKS